MGFGFLSSVASAACGGLSRLSHSLRGAAPPPVRHVRCTAVSSLARHGLASVLQASPPTPALVRRPLSLPTKAASSVSPFVGFRSPAAYVAKPFQAPSFSDPRLSPEGKGKLRRSLLSAMPHLHAFDLNTVDRIVDCLSLQHFAAGDHISCDLSGFFLVAEGCVLGIVDTSILRSSHVRFGAGAAFKVSVPSSTLYFAGTCASLFFAPTALVASQVSADLFAAPPASRQAALADLHLSDFVVERMLGSGYYGAVALVTHTLSGRSYVLKQIYRTTDTYEPQKEAEMVQLISDAPLIPFAVDACRDSLAAFSRAFFGRQARFFSQGSDIFFLQEPLLGGSYDDLLREIGAPSIHDEDELVLSESDARFYIACLILGVHHIHSTRHLHRDIKTDNVMLDYLGYLTVIDNSFLIEVDEFGMAKGAAGTLHMVAPEVVKHCETGYSFTSEYWSIGGVLLRMVAGRDIFEVDSSNQRLVFAAIKSPQPVSLPAGLSPELHDLLSGLFAKHPKMRLGARHGLQELRDHAFFDGFDWGALERREMTPPFVPVLSAPDDCDNLGELDDPLEIIKLPTS